MEYEIHWLKDATFSAYLTYNKVDEPWEEEFYAGEVDTVKMSEETDGTVSLCFVDANTPFHIFGVSTKLFEIIEREY